MSAIKNNLPIDWKERKLFNLLQPCRQHSTLLFDFKRKIFSFTSRPRIHHVSPNSIIASSTVSNLCWWFNYASARFSLFVAPALSCHVSNYALCNHNLTKKTKTWTDENSVKISFFGSRALLPEIKWQSNWDSPPLFSICTDIQIFIKFQLSRNLNEPKSWKLVLFS